MTSNSVAIDLRLASVRVGGISRYATELYQALRKHSSIDIRSIRSRRDAVIEPGMYRFSTPPHHRFENAGLAIETLVSTKIPSLFHAPDFLAPRIPGVSTIATVHDLTFMEHPEFLQTDALRYYRRIQRTRKWTDGWITPSEWTANALHSTLDIDLNQIFVVPHGVPAGYNATEFAGRHQRGNYLLAVGTVEPRKQYDLLLDALEILNESSRKSPRLIVVGSLGWQSENTQERMLTCPTVEWRQGLSDKELRVLYQNATCLVIPSQTEGFGFAALESMACGTPVISSGGGALNEVTGTSALRPGDSSPLAWAEAIDQVFSNDQLWQQLAEDGQKRATSYSWKTAAVRTVDVYREVLHRQK